MRKPLSIAVFALLVGGAGGSRAAEPFRGDIEKMAEQNTDFRRVLFTGPNMQIVAMSLPPGEDIGEEVHKVDQCFFFVSGTAVTIADGQRASVGPNGLLCVPAGTRHNIRNTGTGPLKLLTVYAPPQHPADTVHHTKAEAEQAEAESHKAR